MTELQPAENKDVYIECQGNAIQQFLWGVVSVMLGFMLVILAAVAMADGLGAVFVGGGVGCLFFCVLVSGMLLWTFHYFHGTDRRIRCNDFEIEFPKEYSAVLHNRLCREWDDLCSIQVIRSVFYDKIKWHPAGKKFLTPSLTVISTPSLSLDFRSGGTAYVYLQNLTREQGEVFFQQLQKHARPTAFSSEVMKLIEQTIAADVPSLTSLWQKDLGSRYVSTNYVPLPPQHELQDGRYKVLMPLSSGGMSSVYYCSRDDGTKVVLKECVIPADLSLEQQAKMKELFDRECTLLAKLQHSQIARVLDAFSENQRDYLVLECVSGRTLKQVVETSGPVNEKTALDWAAQLAKILSYLQEQDPPVIHRDISPDNIILREDGSLVLIDFGAANEYLGTVTGTFIGKHCYMSPEQVRGEATIRSDIYSLGATLFYCLTGSEPVPLFKSSPRSVREDISADFDAIIQRCTELDELARFDSATALRAALGDTQLATVHAAPARV